MSASAHSTHQKQLAVRRILSGKSTIIEEADRHGVTRTAVSRWVKSPEFRNGLEITEASGYKPRTRWTLEFKQEAAARVEAGERPVDVARDLRVPVNTLSKWTRGEGMQRGRRGDAATAATQESNSAEVEAAEMDWTEERKLDICTRWQQGESMKALCAEYGVKNAAQVYAWATQRGIARDPLRSTVTIPVTRHPQREEVIARYRAGGDAKELADAYSIPIATVYRWIGDDLVRNGRPAAANGAPAQQSLAMGEPSQPQEENGGEATETRVTFGLPTRKVSPEILERSRRVPKKILTSYACPHCMLGVPPPPRALPGQLVATQFQCPDCQGVIII